MRRDKINMSINNTTLEVMAEVENIEMDICNMPLIFAEMFKDEINAVEEDILYNGIKGIIKKYSKNNQAIDIVNEFTSIISGGASLEEILSITREEALNPTLASQMTVDESCRLD